MHVAEVVRKYETKAGPSESRSYLLRRSFRENGKVRHETLANLSALPPQAVAALREVLAGKTLVVADEGFELLRARPHGHVAAVAERVLLLQKNLLEFFPGNAVGLDARIGNQFEIAGEPRQRPEHQDQHYDGGNEMRPCVFHGAFRSAASLRLEIQIRN